MYSIYMFTNKITDKRYIGYARWVKTRKSDHTKADTPLGRAIREYGMNNFDYEIIYQTDTLIEAKDIELFYIKFYDSVKQGYNQVCAASGPSEEGKKRISEARKGTMVVKDAKTGKILKAVSINHPKVLSGEWVHHSKGMTLVWDPFLRKRKRVPMEEKGKYSAQEFHIQGQSADSNSRYSGYTRIDIIKKFLAYVTWIKNFAEDPKVFSGSNFNEWARKIDSKFPNFPGCLKPFRFPEFHKRTLNSLINLTIVNRNENNYLKDLARTKSDNQRKKLSEINLGNTLSEKHKKNIKKGLQKHYGNKN